MRLNKFLIRKQALEHLGGFHRTVKLCLVQRVRNLADYSEHILVYFKTPSSEEKKMDHRSCKLVKSYWT